VDAALNPPNEVQEGFNKHQYRYAHQCCEVLCMASRDIKEFVLKNDIIMRLLIDYLKERQQQLNPVIVSFYGKLVMSLITAPCEEFLERLMESDFLSNCICCLEYAAVFELLCGIVTALPEHSYRLKVKKWYAEKGLVDHLVVCLSTQRPPQVHENAAALWSEFVRSLRDLQYSLEVTADHLLDALCSEENVGKLLSNVFPEDEKDQSLSLVENGASVLNTLLETKFDNTAPSVLLAQADNIALNIQTSIGNEGDARGGDLDFAADPKRIVETLCVQHVDKIIKLILYSVKAPLSEHCGSIFMALMQLLSNLLNTNYLPTHSVIADAFANAETSLAKLFDVITWNPLMTIYNTQLTSCILHILFSSTESESPLLSYLIQRFNVTKVIRSALDQKLDLSPMQKIGRRSFFMHLADRIQFSLHHAPESHRIEALLADASDYKEWESFCEREVKEYADKNRTETISERRSTLNGTFDVAIDELNLSNEELQESLAEDTNDFFERRQNMLWSDHFETPKPPEAAAGDTDTKMPGRRSPTADIFDEIFMQERAKNSAIPTKPVVAEDEDWPTGSNAGNNDFFTTMPADDFRPAKGFFGGETFQNGDNLFKQESKPQEGENAQVNGAIKDQTVQNSPGQSESFANFNSPKVPLGKNSREENDLF
jgi:hypothetical protein